MSQISDAIGCMKKNNRAARAVRPLLQCFSRGLPNGHLKISNLKF